MISEDFEKHGRSQYAIHAGLGWTRTKLGLDNGGALVVTAAGGSERRKMPVQPPRAKKKAPAKTELLVFHADKHAHYSFNHPHLKFLLRKRCWGDADMKKVLNRLLYSDHVTKFLQRKNAQREKFSLHERVNSLHIVSHRDYTHSPHQSIRGYRLSDRRLQKVMRSLFHSHLKQATKYGTTKMNPFTNKHIVSRRDYTHSPHQSIRGYRLSDRRLQRVMRSLFHSHLKQATKYGTTLMNPFTHKYNGRKSAKNAAGETMWNYNLPDDFEVYLQSDVAASITQALCIRMAALGYARRDELISDRSRSIRKLWLEAERKFSDPAERIADFCDQLVAPPSARLIAQIIFGVSSKTHKSDGRPREQEPSLWTTTPASQRSTNPV